MHVIAGSQKGRKLVCIEPSVVRPTSGRVKEALFSIIGHDLTGVWFLDLFAGTGAVGIEALSRGAHRVAFVDSHPKALQCLRKNLAHCDFFARVEIQERTVDDFLRRSFTHRPFDIVFADPPYDEDRGNSLLSTLGRSAMIAPGTVIILEHPTKRLLTDRIGRLLRTRHYRYGDTSLSKYQVLPDGTEPS
jgi:16S rRNA (guanine(966)-N(2))-methyltransferase RsmD